MMFPGRRPEFFLGAAISVINRDSVFVVRCKFPTRFLPTIHNVGEQLYPAWGGHSPYTHHIVIKRVACFYLTSKRTEKPWRFILSPTFIYMKLWIDVCAFCLSAVRINQAFPRKNDVHEIKNTPCSFGSFSVRAFFPAVKNAFTYAIDDNLFIKFQGCWSEYSDLNALDAVWNQAAPPSTDDLAPPSKLNQGRPPFPPPPVKSRRNLSQRSGP
jgi:hypothetical protein